MPKKSFRTKRSPPKARRSKRAGARTTPARRKPLPDDEALVDGCDIHFTATDATPDAELPQARGGVETAASRRKR